MLPLVIRGNQDAENLYPSEKTDSQRLTKISKWYVSKPIVVGAYD